MVITLDNLRQTLAEFERLFPEPDPNAKVEDSIGCFEGIVPKGKTGVGFIREERDKEFGIKGDEVNE